MTKRELHDELDVLEWVFSFYNVIFSLDNQFRADNLKAISVKLCALLLSWKSWSAVTMWAIRVDLLTCNSITHDGQISALVSNNEQTPDRSTARNDKTPPRAFSWCAA